MNYLFNNKKVLFLFSSFLISFFFFYILIYNFPIRFQENDDVVMLLLANGHYTGFFESNLIFIHPLYGRLLNFLYAKSDAYEWYTLLFLGFHLISLILVFFKIFNSKFTVVLKINLMILSLIICGNMLVYLQYTTTAFALVISGIITLDFNNKYKLVFGTFLIFIASLIRFEATMLTLLIYTAYFFLLNRKNIKKEIKSFIYILFLIFSFFIINEIPRLCSNDDWKSYYAFSKASTGIGDNLLADDTESIYSGVCSKEEYGLLKSFYIDKNLIDLHKVKALVINVDKKNTIQLYIVNFINQISAYKVEIFILLSLVLFILFQLDNFNRINIIFILTFIFMLSFYITMDATLKDRVFIGLVMILILIICRYLSYLSIKSTYVVAMLFFLLSIYYANMLVTRINDNRIARFYIYPNSKKIVDEISSNDSSSYIIPYSSFFKVELEDPFNISNNFKNNRFYFFGWMALTPYNSKIDKDNELNISKKYLITLANKKDSPIYDLIKNLNTDIEILRLVSSEVYN